MHLGARRRQGGKVVHVLTLHRLACTGNVSGDEIHGFAALILFIEVSLGACDPAGGFGSERQILHGGVIRISNTSPG